MLSRVEFRKRITLPIGIPFNPFLLGIVTLQMQLILALIDATSLGATVLMAIILVFVFLTWEGMRIQYKNRLYEEYTKLVNTSFEDFLAGIHRRIGGG